VYRPIDLDRAARDEFGPTARAVAVGNHLYDWRASVNSALKPLDVKRAVASQYGPAWKLVALGVGKDDWKAVDVTHLQFVILPVMEVASDRWFDIAGVSAGLARYRTVLTATRNWYQAQVGKTFRYVQPIVIYTDKTSAQWNAISASTEVPDTDPNRWNLINEVKKHYLAHLPMPGAQLAVAAAPYSGDSPNVWLGAADTDHFAIAPPRATSVTCPATGAQNALCADAEYAIGHELGHAFGLSHSCVAYPSNRLCEASIMQARKPWSAILLPAEIAALQASAFFH